MSTERLIRVAMKPLLPKLVPPLEADDLLQEGRIALWLRGHGRDEAEQVVIARNAMVDALRASRWACRSSYESGDFQMANYDDWTDYPEGMTDCHAASMVAVRQCLERLGQLSDRQRQVLGWLASGMDKSDVARQLGVTPSRVCQMVSELRAVVARYV